MIRAISEANPCRIVHSSEHTMNLLAKRIIDTKIHTSKHKKCKFTNLTSVLDECLVPVFKKCCDKALCSSPG